MAKDDDDDAGPSFSAIRDRIKKWPWGSSKSKDSDDTSSTSAAPTSSSGLYSPPPWLPLPKIVMAAFSLNLLFLLIGLIVSCLVLGGTITIDAKAIGLTESLVLISSMFSLSYMGFHMLAARRPDPVEGLTSKKRTSRHTKIILLGRITTALWSISLLAVAITIGSLPASAASSKSPLQAGLAACIMHCLDMTVILLVVERTAQPFVLPWLTPPIPEAQTLAAKALIDGILGDGVAGHPYNGQTTSSTAEEDITAVASASRASSEGEEAPAVTPKRKMRVTIKDLADEDGDPTVSTSTLAPPPSVGEPFGQPSAATLVERQEIWNRVDEGAAKNASTIKLPPHPSTFLPQHIPPIPPQHLHYAPGVATGPGPYIMPEPSPMYPYYPPQPVAYISPLQTTPYPPTPPAAPPVAPAAAAIPTRPPLSRAAGSGVPRYSYTAAATSIAAPAPGMTGPRPLYEAGRLHSYTAYVNNQRHAEASSSGSRSDGVRSVPPQPMGARPPPPVKGKRLFDKAVEGLKASEKRKEQVWDDYSTIHVPGSFVEM
ncbi:hypothetical protein SEUCBS139899_006596 [Sporothrix eucalyptigena]|uniref:Uncharacterized protein n=1 Tax=Sporothrix eucalyptigena TaxID=1812306 RepID=A0ABP0B334_9PEZI